MSEHARDQDWIDDWTRRAACLGVDAELFFPERGASVDEAKKICRRCPVRLDCLDYAMINGEKHGIWGGKSERERRQLRRQVSLGQHSNAASCGTRSGYEKHRRLGEVPCADCTEASRLARARGAVAS